MNMRYASNPWGIEKVKHSRTGTMASSGRGEPAICSPAGIDSDRSPFSVLTGRPPDLNRYPDFAQQRIGIRR